MDEKEKKESALENLSEPQQVQKLVNDLVNDIIHKAEKMVSPTDSGSNIEKEMSQVILVEDSLEKKLADVHGVSVDDSESKADLIIEENKKVEDLQSKDLEAKLDIQTN